MEFTREQILSMQTGEELDKLVAIHVMEWSIYHYDKDVEERCYYMLVDGNFEPIADDVPFGWHNGERKTEELAWADNKPFSTDLSEAWKVVDEMGGFTQITREKDSADWHCSFSTVESVRSEELSEAICKAALIHKLLNA